LHKSWLLKGKLLVRMLPNFINLKLCNILNLDKLNDLYLACVSNPVAIVV